MSDGNAPRGTHAGALRRTHVTEWKDGIARRVEDELAAEEPLEIRLGEKPLTVTMRTPGHDEELAAGFLLTEGIIERPGQIASLTPFANNAASKSNGIRADLADADFDIGHLQRNFFAASSCGICGKASIEAIRQRGLRSPESSLRITGDLLCTLPEKMHAAQTVFGRTGGLHAAALFDAAGNLVVLREDIGRHNAVDKVIGWSALQGLLPLSDSILLVSGRAGFEIVQKALAARIPVLASVSAPSSLAVQLARELGLTLAGFLRERRFVIYACPGRLAK